MVSTPMSPLLESMPQSPTILPTAARLAKAVAEQTTWDADMRGAVLQYQKLQDELEKCEELWMNHSPRGRMDVMESDAFQAALTAEVRRLDNWYEARMCNFVETAALLKLSGESATCTEHVLPLRKAVKALRTWVDINHIALVTIHDAYVAATAAHFDKPRNLPWLFERAFFTNDTGLSMLIYELSTLTAHMKDKCNLCKDPLPSPGRECTATPECSTKVKKIKEQCHKLVPSWSHQPDLVVRVLTGGLTNYLYTAELDNMKSDVTPKRVVVRFFGGGDLIDRDAESKIAAALCAKRIGVHIYGEFEGGRVEAFSEGQPLRFYHLGRLGILRNLAKQIAELHRLEVPGIKRDPQLLTIIDGYLKQAQAVSFTDEVQRVAAGPAGVNRPSMLKKDGLTSMQDLFDWEAEVTWMRRLVTSRPMDIVFIHCDVQEGNLLVKDPAANKPDITIIDFEYSRYDYAAFDIGNFFCEAYIDNFYPEFPFFRCNHVTVPSHEIRRHFLTLYLQRRGIITMDTPAPTAASIVEKWLEDVHYMMMASHLQWGLWSVVQAKESAIDEFCYLSYGLMRLSEYKRMKAEGPPMSARGGYSS